MSNYSHSDSTSMNNVEGRVTNKLKHKSYYLKYHLKLTPDINVNPMKHLVICVVLVTSNETIEVWRDKPND